MRTVTTRSGLLLVAGSLVFAQTGGKPLTFDVATVKPAPKPVFSNHPVMFGRVRGGPGTSEPGRMERPNLDLKSFLLTAYNIKYFQLEGPAWLDTERFDISATMPPSTTMEQYRVMLQNLLKERFRMQMHRETRVLPIFSLVVAKNGPKLHRSASLPATGPEHAPPQPKMGPDGPIHEIPPVVLMMAGRGHIVGRQQTMQDLAGFLTSQVGRRVEDATGLAAKYDFTLSYSTEGLNGPRGSVQTGAEADVDPPLPVAIQAQLGLRLEPKKGPVEIIVIDHIEKTPTAN